MILNKNKTGLSIGTFFGLGHLLWVLAIAAGLAETVARWWHSTHFVSMQYTIGSLDFVTITTGLLGALVTGYVTGYVFAVVWNVFNK